MPAALPSYAPCPAAAVAAATCVCTRRKGCLLRLQRHLHELLLDQLPVLRQLARVLDEISLGVDGGTAAAAAAAAAAAGGGGSSAAAAASARLIIEQVCVCVCRRLLAPCAA
jgi:hypothetical protein